MYYSHSGHVNLGGLLIGLILGVPTALILAYAYAHGLVLITEQHFAVFATLAFGFLVGGTVGQGLVWGKVRNKPLAIFLATCTAVLALYASWAMWLSIILKNQESIYWGEIFVRPDGMWRLMVEINKYGTWTDDHGDTAKGAYLWFLWATEAVAILAFAITGAILALDRNPYCESCDRWCRRTAHFLLTPVRDTRRLALELESKFVDTLATLGPADKNTGHMIVDLRGCDSCRQFYTLTIKQMTGERTRFGGSRAVWQSIVDKLIVGPTEAQAIQQVAEKLKQPGTARAAAAGTKK